MFRDVETVDIKTVDEGIDESDRRCGNDEICKYQTDCPEFLKQREIFRGLRRGSQKYKDTLERIKNRVCNKSKKGVCCPNPKKEDWLPGKGECGTNPDSPPSNVVGGVATTPGQFPFTALLGYPNSEEKWIERTRKWETINNIQYNCGGTLINHWYVVTAAHCQGSSEASQISQVRLGEWEVGRDPDCLKDSDTCLSDVQDFEITNDQVTVHEDYRRTPSNVENDIALIRLTRPAVLNNGVRIVCLPINPQEAARELNIPNIRDGLTGKFPIVVGWGYTEYDPWALEQQGDFAETNVASSVQQMLGVPVLSSSECSEKFGKFKPSVSQICAGGEKDKDSCKVDLLLEKEKSLFRN